LVVLAVVVALETLMVLLAAAVVMLERMKPAAEVVLDARQIAGAKVRGSRTGTTHQLVEEREYEASDLLGAVNDVSGAITKHR
jgi:hypothetical protein